jgi:hypothetical protein
MKRLAWWRSNKFAGWREGEAVGWRRFYRDENINEADDKPARKKFQFRRIFGKLNSSKSCSLINLVGERVEFIKLIFFYDTCLIVSRSWNFQIQSSHELIDKCSFIATQMASPTQLLRLPLLHWKLLDCTTFKNLIKFSPPLVLVSFQFLI